MKIQVLSFIIFYVFLIMFVVSINKKNKYINDNLDQKRKLIQNFPKTQIDA